MALSEKNRKILMTSVRFGWPSIITSPLILSLVLPRIKQAPVARARDTNVIILEPKHFISYEPKRVVRKKTARAPVSCIETS